MSLNELNYDRFLDCVHCGLCTAACPTYSILGTEMDSPRGRIYLMRSLADGKIEWNDTVIRHLDLCLGCLACESACPSGVDYSQIIEWGRAEIEQHHERPVKQAFLRKILVEQIFAHPARLQLLLAPIRLGRKLGVFQLMRRMRLPDSLTRMEAMLPEHLNGWEEIAEITPAIGERRYRVGLLTGCVARIMFSGVNAATVRVLALNGCEVVTPKDQVCCGALYMHNGNPEAAKAMIRTNLDVFGRYELDAIIVNAAGCGSTMKEYGHILCDEPSYATRAAEFQNRTKDVCEFLAGLPDRRKPHPLNMKVTYHDACHLAHGQKIRKEPRQIIRSIPGVELVEMNEADWCCGSAGVYNITEPEMSQKLLNRKIDNILSTGVDAVVTGNPGCLLQLGFGLRQRGLALEVLHPVELLSRAYSPSDG